VGFVTTGKCPFVVIFWEVKTFLAYEIEYILIADG